MGREAVLGRPSSRFNEGLLLGIVDLGANALYVDSAYYVNLYTGSPSTYGFNKAPNPPSPTLYPGSPSSYGFNNATDAVCTSVDASNGIGIGPGQINAALCNSATLRPDAKQDTYVFADFVHLTPSAQRQFGTFAYDRLRARW